MENNIKNLIYECPNGLKSCSYETLNLLAKELRTKIIETVSNTGGHLASNLGSVELTIALHRVFNSPKDKIIWDVGHQAYSHKLLTGRWDNFHTLRQKNGICGYPNRDESKYDAFNVGHSSTSISAALGMALARDLNGEDFNVIGIIGDGAITAGMSFEAMNMLGYTKTPAIIVLNENGISISPNVGAFGAYTNRLTNKIVYSPVFNEVRKDIHYLLDNIKDEKMLEITRNLRSKALTILSDEIFFETLGFAYFGPVDGHNIKEIEKALEEAKKVKGPVIVHVKTIKGKDYKPAEVNPTKYHGASPFNIETGEFIKNNSAPPTYQKVFGEALVELCTENNKIIGITAAMAPGTSLDLLQKAYPHRFFDVGIAEQNAVTMAAGMACEGIIPVVAIYSTFLQRAYDQVIHDVCMQNLHVVFAMDRGGLVGDDGPTHHGTFDLSFLRLIPNLVLMAPKDENELRNMLKTAVEYKGPIALRYPRGSGVGVELESMKTIEIGKGEIVKDTKNPDAVLIAVGRMVDNSLKAAEILEKEGKKIKVINARFIKPLDKDLILSAIEECNKVFTVEENNLPGGFGSAVLELLEDNIILEKGKTITRIGIPDEFIEWGTIPELMDITGLSPEKIAERVKQKL
ncbi:MAG: 1-deoxy-D-xylulose-5-phosphate synthase [Candidatus Micrarchaeia archaeon]|jgi:1-deoxy-D-xylulose-5-phosphate synthase